MEAYKIAIVDDNRETLKSLSDLIAYTKEFELVFTAKNGLDYLEKMEEIEVSKLPQIILMDLEMPDMDGIQAMQLSRMKYPFVKYIVLTAYDNEDMIFRAIQAGAHGYLLKDEKVTVIKEHIKDLLNNQARPMSPSIAKKTFEILSKISTTPKETSIEKSQLLSNLSVREVDVLKLMEEGHNYKVISEKLFISTNTVRTHIAHIYEKLHVSSKYQMLNLLKG